MVVGRVVAGNAGSDGRVGAAWKVLAPLLSSWLKLCSTFAPFVDVDDEFQAAAGGPPRWQGVVAGYGERVVYQDLTLSVHSA